MQYKLPIVTTDEGGIPDVVTDGENGFVCQRKDSISVANAIENLFNDKNIRIQMGENGYKIFKEKFTLEQFCNNILSILKKQIKH